MYKGNQCGNVMITFQHKGDELEQLASAVQEELFTSMENYGDSYLSYVLGLQKTEIALKHKVELATYYRDETGKLVQGSIDTDPIGLHEAKSFWKQF